MEDKEDSAAKQKIEQLSHSSEYIDGFTLGAARTSQRQPSRNSHSKNISVEWKVYRSFFPYLLKVYRSPVKLISYQKKLRLSDEISLIDQTDSILPDQVLILMLSYRRREN